MKNLMQKAREVRRHLALPAAARAEARRDREQGLYEDPGIEIAVDAAVTWLAQAQDNSRTQDGGVARDYSLIDGWNSSYPETTGYIVPTVIAEAGHRDDPQLLERAARMLDWLVDIQLPGGGFQGGLVDATPVVPVTFNTGQILIGLASGVEHFGDRYAAAMHAAAGWLRDSLDDDGCWRKHPTPFAASGEKAYETHVSWGLFEAARVSGDKSYADAARRNIDWALTQQRDNGWFESCCLDDPSQPLTHTIGYVLRGLLEANAYQADAQVLAAARRTATGVLGALQESGRLPGRLGPQWQERVDYVCLTGAVQIAHCWLMLYQLEGDVRFRDAGFAANEFVRRSMYLGDDVGKRGGIKGSFPVSGNYGTYQYLNWAAKFFIDANRLEQAVRQADASTAD